MIITLPEVSHAAHFRDLLKPTGIPARVRAGSAHSGTISVTAKDPHRAFTDDEQRMIKVIAVSISLSGKHRPIEIDGPHGNRFVFTFTLPGS